MLVNSKINESKLLSTYNMCPTHENVVEYEHKLTDGWTKFMCTSASGL